MIKIIMNFFILWVAVTVAIGMWNSLSRQEKWSTVKIFAYGFTTAAIAFVILTTIVILF